MKLRTFLCAATLLAAAPLGIASAQTSTAAPISGFHMEVLQLESDPPSNVRSAPGGGRTLAPSILYTPAKGANPQGPAIIMLDDGPGSHPSAAGQASRFAAEKLAAQGYTVLSLFSGQERNFTSVPFDDVKWAVKNALDYLEHAGYEDFALAGQGYGALVAANYVKSLPDTTLDNGPERRVKGLILINPLMEITKYPGFGDSKGYDDRYALAKKQIADRTGLYLANLEPGHSTEGNQADWFMQGIYVGPAQTWIDYWSSEAAARNAALLQNLPVQTLVLAGDKVPMSPVEKVKALAGDKIKIVIVPGGTDNLSSVSGAVTDDIAHWLKAQDLGTRPAIHISTADITNKSGIPLFALVYEPEGGADPEKPVLMLIHGRSGDTLQSSTHWMGWRFARNGYKVIAPSLQISGATGIETKTMADVQNDIGDWMNAAQAMGAKRVVLAGHSNGGIWITNYVANTHDKRVAGMIYFAPTADAAKFQISIVGQAAYDKDNARAYKSIKEGRGLTDVLGVNTAVAFADLYGSKSPTVHSERVKQITLPGLAIAGGKDELMSDAFLASFKAGYRGEFTLIRYPDGSHGFRESKDRLVDDATGWLDKTIR